MLLRRIARQAVAAAFAGLVALAAASSAMAAERILDFDSRLQVQRDAALVVTETIRVVAEGDQIKRGIYRDFPTTYRSLLGLTVRVGFQVLGVQRDGHPEPYRLESIGNGVRVYIGQSDVLLRPGTYNYTLSYVTTGQIGFFSDYDELYWNVTGNGWIFPIDRVRATVELPPGAGAFNPTAYTGAEGDTGRDFAVARDSVGNTVFMTTRPLGAREGLTVALAWQKGVVAAPSERTRQLALLRDNLSVVAAALGLIVVLAYYLVAWWRVGRDPARGTIIPLFHPPEGFSPAAVRYVMRMGFDQKAFAAAVVGMAVKGWLTIEDERGSYRLNRTDARTEALTADERAAFQQLFAGGATLELKNVNHRRLKDAIAALKNQLARDFEAIYFLRNARWLIPGLALTGLTLLATVAFAPEIFPALFMVVWLSGWTVGCYFLTSRVIGLWHSRAWAGAVFSSIFAVPFLAGEAFGLFMFGTAVSIPAGVLLVILAFLGALFHRLLRAPTLRGRRIMDEIEGFKLYLTVAEQDRLEALNPPELTPALFEKYLPYALALDVENAWSAKFAATLDAAGERAAAYSPSWYRGAAWSTLGAAGFAGSLGGSFAGAIASSSTAPGSSSGSSGGGSSGGGGGGGGGGGW
jgi:uncharacterized membrane protein YgcG